MKLPLSHDFAEFNLKTLEFITKIFYIVTPVLLNRHKNLAF